MSNVTNQTVTKVDSQIVYRIEEYNYLRMTNSYYKNKNQGSILERDKKVLIKTEPVKINNETNRTTNIIFINNKSMIERNYYIQDFPDINSFNTNMIVHVNFDNITKHLLLQRVLNNYYLVTGFIFLITGVILCFFGIYETLILATISLVFGQLIIFIVCELAIGIGQKYFELLLIGIGLIIGVISLYFSKKYLKFYKFVLGMTSGMIFGTFITEIFVFSNGYTFIFAIFIDNLIISVASFLFIVYVIKKFYLYLYSIIGGYIFIRGLSILLFKYFGYRELQLILYLVGSYEYEYFINPDSRKELQWNLYWIYDILIVVFIIISIIFYRLQRNYLKRKLKIKDNEEYDAEETEKKLNKDLF